MPRHVVMGLDLSLRASAALVIPAGWELGRWNKLVSHVVGSNLLQDADQGQKLSRLESISDEIVKFARDNHVTHVFVEQYAFSQMLTRAHAIGELGGVVKLDLRRKLGLVVMPVVASQARKFLCGTVPRKDSKDFVIAKLVDMGANFQTDDEGDAFVVANWGLSELGLVALSVGAQDGATKPTGEKPCKPSSSKPSSSCWRPPSRTSRSRR